MALIRKFTGRKAQSEMRKNKNGNGIRWVAALLPLCVAVSMPLTANAQTNAEMTEAAGKRYVKADKAMNAIYKKLMGKLDAKQKAKLKASQIAWLKFRDADASFRSKGWCPTMRCQAAIRWNTPRACRNSRNSEPKNSTPPTKILPPRTAGKRRNFSEAGPSNEPPHPGRVPGHE